MNVHALNPTDSFRLIRVDMCIDFIWHRHVVDLTVATQKKLGSQFFRGLIGIGNGSINFLY